MSVQARADAGLKTSPSAAFLRQQQQPPPLFSGDGAAAAAEVDSVAGGGFALFNAFDDERLRPFGSWTLSGGGGVEFSFGSGFTRVEIGVGQRDLRLELSGTFGVGFVFSPAQ